MSSITTGLTITKIEEGKEPKQFWESLGGKKWYPIRNRTTRRLPRLYQCGVGTGVFDVEEIVHYCQDDLMSDDVYILDSGEDIFVWVGRKATKREKKMAMEVSLLYLEKIPNLERRNSFVRKQHREDEGEGIGVFLVDDGEEPLYFTSLFHGWNELIFHGKISSKTPQDRISIGLPLPHIRGLDFFISKVFIFFYY